MDVSIVIVSWNSRRWLEACLGSVFQELKKRPALSTEVVVVDNASTDESLEMLRAYPGRVEVIENAENLGFAAANNQGIRQTVGWAILLLNPDTELHPGALDALVRFLREHPDVAAVAPRLVGGDGKPQESTFPFPTLWRELRRLFHAHRRVSFGSDASRDESLSEWHFVDVLQGACLLLRRQALEQVGVLDEDYFMYSEEVDLCRRLHVGGWKSVWLPAAVVLHHGGCSTEQVPRRMFLELYRSKVLFFRKNHGRRVARLYKIILLVAAVARCMLVPFSVFESPTNRRRHRELARRYLLLLQRVWGF